MKPFLTFLRSLFVFSLCIFFSLGCERKDEPIPAYGCESKVVETITDGVGTLHLDRGPDRLYIVVRGVDFFDRIYEICNPEGVAVAQLGDMPNVVRVKFSGDVRSNPPPAEASSFTSYKIALTSISRP